MARRFDFRKLTVITRTLSTSSSGAAGNSVTGPARPAAAVGPRPGAVGPRPGGAGRAAPPAGDGATAAGSLINRLRSDKTVSSLLQYFEDAVGIGDVKRAQKRVTQIEQEFTKVHENIQISTQNLRHVQAELRAIRAKLDRTPRDDTRFLEYATEEHLAIQKERKMDEQHNALEDAERSLFATMSAAVRESHEQQRSQQERTKYWGVIGSILVTVIGLVGSTAFNQMRMRELRTMVGDQQKDIGRNGQLRDLQGLVTDNRTTIEESGAQSSPGQLADALERLSKQQQEGLEAQEKSLNKVLQQQEGLLLKELEGVRRIAAVGAGDMTTLEEMVNHAEQKVESETKMSVLSTIASISGPFVLVLSILYNIFK